jgi:hypothetical protein
MASRQADPISGNRLPGNTPSPAHATVPISAGPASVRHGCAMAPGSASRESAPAPSPTSPDSSPRSASRQSGIGRSRSSVCSSSATSIWSSSGPIGYLTWPPLPHIALHFEVESASCKPHQSRRDALCTSAYPTVATTAASHISEQNSANQNRGVDSRFANHAACMGNNGTVLARRRRAHLAALYTSNLNSKINRLLRTSGLNACTVVVQGQSLISSSLN